MYKRIETDTLIYYVRSNVWDEFKKSQWPTEKVALADVVINKENNDFLKNRFFYNTEGFVDFYIREGLGEYIENIEN